MMILEDGNGMLPELGKSSGRPNGISVWYWRAALMELVISGRAGVIFEMDKWCLLFTHTVDVNWSLLLKREEEGHV